MTTPAISGRTRLYGVLGHPIGQVRSPEYFNAWFAVRGIDAVLVPLDVPPAAFALALAGLRALANLDGVIATVPHKAVLLAALEEVTPRARLAGGANVARPLGGGRWTGDMLDGIGFVNGLRGRGFEPRGERAMLVGAGGVGRAIAVSLAEAGIAAFAVTDLDPTRTAALAASVRAAFPKLAVSTGMDALREATLVINATPLGMRPDDPLPVDVERIAPGAFVAEVVSKPERSPLVVAAEARGHRTATGKDLFEGQAEAMQHFFGWSR